ncbi:hypothetical protein GF360_03140 [candidate division WWE3 bacterium]|nr:hypothetical protein [candidate division WWE3 bacterium]
MNLKSILLGIITGLIVFLSVLLLARKIDSKKKDVLSATPQESSQKATKTLAENSSIIEITNFDDLKNHAKSKTGTYGIYIENLNTKQKYTYNAQDSFYGASLYKILVAGAVYDAISEDKLSFNYIYTYENTDYTSGSGVLQNYAQGTTYSIDELLDFLLKSSDNIAQNILERNLEVKDIIDFYKRHTKMPAEKQNFSNNLNTNPKEIAQILTSIYQDSTWSKELKRDFFERMTKTEFEDRIAQTLPLGATFSHKIGNAPQLSSWHDCGIIFAKDFTQTTVVCLMSKNTQYEQFLEVSHGLGSFIKNTFAY